MNFYETEIGKESRKRFGKLKKGDIVKTFLNEKNEILSSIRINISKNGIIKIDLKQFKDYIPTDSDLFVDEIIENLFDYTFDICSGGEVEYTNKSIVI